MSDTTRSRTEPGAARASVWTRPDRGARGPSPEHSRAEIAAAAITLADLGGLRAVSMRAVAGTLGTTAGSLYRYLSSRDELLDLMGDAVLEEMHLNREPVGSWLDDLVALADDQSGLYRRHPWLLETSLRGGTLGPNAVAYFEDCLRIMAPVNRGTQAKMEAVAMITGIVSLFARGTSLPTPNVAPSNIFATATPERHPHLIAALARSAQASPPRQDMFERTIRSVLGGLLADDL